MGQLLLKMFVGAVAGLMIWVLFEPMAPVNSLGQPWETWENWFVLTLGAAIGLAVGGLNGWIQGSRVHLARGALLGLLFGAIGATLGHALGGQIAIGMFGNVIGNPTVNIATRTVARTIALTPIGICLGLGIGASSLNKRRTVQGLIGGLIGAAAGGILFDTLSAMIAPFAATVQGVHAGATAEIGAPSRALYAILLGGLIALFIGIVDLVSRSAWIRLVLGRNEGKEWPIDSAQTFIGRAEKAQIPLFGDPNIAPMHACITKQANAYTISDGGSPMGTYVNGQRITQAPLFHGAQIQVGSYQLQFLVKHGAAPVRDPEHFNQAYAIQNQPPQGQPVGVAPYSPSPGAQYPAPGPGQPTVAFPTPSPGSLYGSQPTQVMPGPSGGFPAAQQPTVAMPQYANTAVPGFTLAVVDGPLIGQRFPVRSPIELGRESASVPMSFDTGASRRHASVSPGPMGVVVSDLNSTNGTFVNGQRVQSANAGPGDLIRIGATTFRVEPG